MNTKLPQLTCYHKLLLLPLVQPLINYTISLYSLYYRHLQQPQTQYCYHFRPPLAGVAAQATISPAPGALPTSHSWPSRSSCVVALGLAGRPRPLPQIRQLTRSRYPFIHKTSSTFIHSQPHLILTTGGGDAAALRDGACVRLACRLVG